MAGLAQEFRDDWFAKGIAKGIAEGETKGEAKLLIRQLERRFGSLSQEAREKVIKANAATLESWGDRVLDAPSLDAVFSDKE